ncbi:MAG: nucleotidyltransferase domain-containing protein [Thermodesulfobacteriota bacterium]
MCIRRLADFCRRRHIRWMACFGSAVREDFGPSSDVDVLMEFAPGHTPGWEIVDIEEELSALFGGRDVDILNPKYLNRRLKDHVLAEAEVIYAEG